MFSPSRLALARKRRQITKKLLAERAGVSQVTLTRIEKGQTLEPEADTVGSLAKVLRYPIDFFYSGDCEELPKEAVSFRSLSSLSARERDAALSAAEVARMFDEWIAKRFNLPDPDLLDLRDEDPASAAISLRRHWGVGSKPIPHLIKLLESKGVRVYTLVETNKSLDAFSFWRSGVPYMFLNTMKSAERSRFDAAHELGHLVMHVHGGTGHREVEKEADRFASALLVPRDDFLANVPRVRSVEQLIKCKSRWRVSVTALARVAYDTGVVTEWHYRELCKQMSHRGYRKREPQPIEREQSVVWKKVFESLWRDGLSKDHVARQLSIPTDEISSLVDGLMEPTDTQQRQPAAPNLKLVQ